MNFFITINNIFCSKKDPTKRQTTFWNSEYPLVSPRVRKILSDPIESEKLADAIRKEKRERR